MEPKEQDSWTNTRMRHERCGNPDPDSLVGRSCHWGNRNDRLAYRILPARGGGRDLPQHVDLTNSGQNAQCCETRGDRWMHWLLDSANHIVYWTDPK